MKNYLGVLLLLGLTSCAAMTADPWGWLDDPQQQYWSEVTINGHGREIHFAIPDRLKSGGQHVLIWPEIDKKKREIVVNMDFDALNQPVTRLADITWDQYWGGFYKKGNHDFSLNVWFKYRSEESNLLDLSMSQRVQRQLDLWKERQSGTDPHSAEQRERFFSKYWVKPFRNDRELNWVVENQPQITADHEIYRIPISDHHELEFSFFVREQRWEFKDDPEWRQSRWDLVKKIMNTVSIEPSPFPDEQ